MILIITLNPLLEYRFFTDTAHAGETLRDVPCTLQAGGKGINVSRQLKKLGIHSYNVTFLGSFYGKKYREVLALEGLECQTVKTTDDTRIAHVHVEQDNKRVTSFFTPNGMVSNAETEDMKKRLEKMIQNCEIVVFSGSSPCPETDGIFPYGIELAHRYDKVSVLDTYGSHLRECLEKGPSIVHNTIGEVEKSLGITLLQDEQKQSFLNELYNKGVKQSFLTDGGKAFYIANHDFHFKVIPPEITTFDATGSGDAFTAGIIKGWYEDLVFDDMVKLATGLGTANAELVSVCSVEEEHALRLHGQVSIEPVGKKNKGN